MIVRSNDQYLTGSRMRLSSVILTVPGASELRFSDVHEVKPCLFVCLISSCLLFDVHRLTGDAVFSDTEKISTLKIFCCLDTQIFSACLSKIFTRTNQRLKYINIYI